MKISLDPDVWAESESGLNDYLWTLTIVNNARASNAIREARCFIDLKQLDFVTEPNDFLKGEIKAYTSRQGLVKVSKEKMQGEFYAVKFIIRPVRGCRRRFTFSKRDLLPEF